jgi:F-type H+-transporting ATPase subunit delta
VAVVARTYAQALFDSAREDGRLGEVREELQEFVTALHDVPELGALLRNPQLDPHAKAEALAAVMEGADELVRNFFQVVAEKGRAQLIEEIFGEYEELVAAEEQILKVELTTALELNETEAASIVEQIEQASGRKVEATRSVDPGLVGGLILKAGSLEVDSSVRGRLDRLRHELQGARQ